MEWSPLGNFLAIGTTDGFEIWSCQSQILIRDCCFSTKRHTIFLRWSPDENHLLAVTEIEEQGPMLRSQFRRFSPNFDGKNWRFS
jgi:hypothetical protein